MSLLCISIIFYAFPYHLKYKKKMPKNIIPPKNYQLVLECIWIPTLIFHLSNVWSRRRGRGWGVSQNFWPCPKLSRLKKKKGSRIRNGVSNCPPSNVNALEFASGLIANEWSSIGEGLQPMGVIRLVIEKKFYKGIFFTWNWIPKKPFDIEIYLTLK